MHKKILFIVVASAAVFAGAGCNKSGKLDTRSQFTTPAGPVELKVKWPVGERVVQDMEMKQASEINVPGQPAPTKQNTTMGQKYALTVLNQDAGGGPELEFEFLSARMSVETGGKIVMAYDSAKPATENKKNAAADVFSKVVGSKIRFFMDASNNVERMEGVDDLVNRLSTTSQDPSATGLKSTFNEGYFKQVMSANKFLPPKPVQPGDTWPVQLEFPLTGLGTMTLDYNITLKSWEMHGKRNCARMEFEGSIKLKADATPAPGGMKVSVPDGTTTGVSWFDPDLGIVIDSVVNQDMTMIITLPGNPKARAGAAGQGMTITNQMSETINVKLDSVK
jgi:hypothetical protein